MIQRTKKSQTQKMTSGVSRYLQDIGKTPLLTGKEEQALARRIQKGDEDARQHMMLANLRLVVSVAKQYTPGNDPDIMMDLIQEGNIGLMKAIDRFHPKFKTRFSTYGIYWIRQAILRSLKSRRLVRLPENVVDRILEMQRTRQKLYQILGRGPTLEELAEEMQASMPEMKRLEEADSDVISLERSVRGRDSAEDTRMGDLIEDTESPSPVEITQELLLKKELRSAVETLPEREREIIDERFGLKSGYPKTLEEIGEQFRISRERVRQLQNVALDRLRGRTAIQQMS